MVDRIIQEINTCLKNECYLSALGMALTLPDICGKAKYPADKTSVRYRKWYKDYIQNREMPEGAHGEETPYLSCDVVYSLRNSLLHQGTPNVDSENIHEERCKVDDFVLVIGEGVTTAGFSWNPDGSIASRELEVDVRSLCGKLTREAGKYYHNHPELFDFFNYTIRGFGKT